MSYHDWFHLMCLNLLKSRENGVCVKPCSCVVFLLCSAQAEITCQPSHRTAMWATCPLCREPVVLLGSAARATCLSNQRGRKETARSGRLMCSGTVAFVLSLNSIKLLSGMNNSPSASLEYMLPRSDVFSFGIVWTWLKSKMHAYCLVSFSHFGEFKFGSLLKVSVEPNVWTLLFRPWGEACSYLAAHT